MAKTQQTLEIEQTLERVCRERRIYGCKEVTIGFPNNHMGRDKIHGSAEYSAGI